MASKRERQRKLERARAERRLARQAHKVRRRRQLQAAVGAGLVVVLLVLGATWALGGFDSTPASQTTASCVWTPKDTATDPNAVDAGTPPTSGEPRTGTENMTIKTDQGDITATLDVAKSPCAAASFSYLGSKRFFDGSRCSLLSPQLNVLQCGDPSGTGAGGPTYTFADEYRPTTPRPPASPSPSAGAASPSPGASATPVYYSRGQIIMVSTGANTNGSQFYIVYGNTSTLSAAYTVVGTVTTGMEIIDKIAAGGPVDDQGKPAQQGRPKIPLTIRQLYVGSPPPPATPTPTTSAGVSTTAKPTT